MADHHIHVWTSSLAVSIDFEANTFTGWCAICNLESTPRPVDQVQFTEMQLEEYNMLKAAHEARKERRGR